MSNENNNIDTEQLDELFEELRFREGAIESAQTAYQAHLQKLATHAGKTFEYRGQWYQVSTRTNKDKETGEVISTKTSLKRLPGAPRTWLTGRAPRTETSGTTETQERGPADIPVVLNTSDPAEGTQQEAVVID